MQAKTQFDELQNYLTDASNMPGGHAEALYFPENAEEVVAVLRESYEAGKKVTVSGARTGTVGGAIPFGGNIISLEKMNRILSIDKEKMTAVVEPGVMLFDLAKAVEAEGLFYPPDPTEWSCQIGGTVATNASGSRSFKYGATRDYVIGLNVVLPDGEMLVLKRGEVISDENDRIKLTTESGKIIEVKIPTYKRPNVRKNVSGYFNQTPLDAIDLFIGSEGTLGVITKIDLRLLKKPEGSFSGIIFFPGNEDLLNFVDEARTLSIQTRGQERIARPGNDIAHTDVRACASLLEYFDSNALKFIAERFPETPANMAGAIFFEQEITEDTEDALLEIWNELLEKNNADLDRSWFTTTAQDLEKMREFRHALPVSVNERVVRNKQKKIGTDMAIPDDNFRSFLRFAKQSLNSSEIDHVIFGHIGDCHLHANLLPKSDEEAVTARHLYGRFVAQSLMLGGCVSAEHGIGKLKSKYLYVMMGERYINEMIELKQAFDPKMLLGSGNMF